MLTNQHLGASTHTLSIHEPDNTMDSGGFFSATHLGEAESRYTVHNLSTLPESSDTSPPSHSLSKPPES